MLRYFRLTIIYTNDRLDEWRGSGLVSPLDKKGDKVQTTSIYVYVLIIGNMNQTMSKMSSLNRHWTSYQLFIHHPYNYD